MREFLNDENSLFNRNTIIEKAMAGKFYFFLNVKTVVIYHQK